MPDIVCPTCNGSKKYVIITQDDDGHDIITKVVCETCDGKGKVKLPERD